MSITSVRPAWTRLGAHRMLWASVCFLLMVASQIALPLAPDAAPQLVTTTVVLLLATSYVIATYAYRPKDILRAFACVLGLAFLVELCGSRTGFPFGTYSYGPALEPQILHVPVLVPLAWASMVLPAIEVARRVTAKPWARHIVGGLALTGWDLFLDPMMTGYDFWTWESTSGWFGIPLTNFAGWVLAGTLICTVAAKTIGSRTIAYSAGLVALYTWMVGFSALGFLLPIAFDRPAIGALGLLVTSPLLLAAFWKRGRPWLES